MSSCCCRRGTSRQRVKQAAGDDAAAQVRSAYRDRAEPRAVATEIAGSVQFLDKQRAHHARNPTSMLAGSFDRSLRMSF